jgi:hypothetical protein
MAVCFQVGNITYDKSHLRFPAKVQSQCMNCAALLSTRTQISLIPDATSMIDSLQVMAVGDTSRELIRGERQVDASVWDHECARFGPRSKRQASQSHCGRQNIHLNLYRCQKVQVPKHWC